MRRNRRPSSSGQAVLERTDGGATTAAGASTDLDDLIAAHGAAVLRLAYSYVRDRAMAEDIFQETFMRWLRHRNSIDNPSRVRPWLLTVAANLSRDHLRSWNHRTMWPTDAVPDVVTPGSTEDHAVAADEARRLADAVMTLPTHFREVVHLHYYEQLDTHEVAAVLGIPPATVRTRLFRARRDLRSMVQEEAPHA
jgi:RNA polymerase sigma-70 factor (ECF subfamily)